MLSPKQSQFGECQSGLLECCNRLKTWQMLLHEDYVQQPEMERNESKYTTDSCATSKEDLFRNTVKNPIRNKVSLSERRNSMNSEQSSKKQAEKLSAFYQPEKMNCKMISQVAPCGAPSYKKQNLGTAVVNLQRQNKTSLRQDKAPNPNRPYLVQFSFIEDFCDKDGNILQADKVPIGKNRQKNQPSLMLLFKEKSPRNQQYLNLKLGQNLPTFRSEFNNTNETFTKRSEVL